MGHLGYRKFFTPGNCTFALPALAALTHSTAVAQDSMYEGWTGSNFQAFQDAPAASAPNQISFFENNSANNDLNHPFFDDSGKNSLAGQDDSKVLKRMFGVEVYHLSRGRLDDVDFVFDDNGPSLSYADVDPADSTSARFRLGLMDAAGRGFEGIYAGLNDFGSTQVIDGPNVIPFFFGGSPLEPQLSYDINYEGEFNTLEFNVWIRPPDNFRCGIGARYIDLPEEFDGVRSAQNTSGFFSDTDNDLFGLQWVGEYSKPFSQRLEFAAGLKLGGFYNNIDSRFFAENVQFHLEDDTFSFATEFNVGIKHKISPSSTFSLGYQLINLSDVAVAPDQGRSVQAFAPSADDLDLDNTFFSGVYAGVNFLF